MKTALSLLIVLIASVSPGFAGDNRAETETLEKKGLYLPRTNPENGMVNLRLVDGRLQLFFLEADGETIREPDFFTAEIEYKQVSPGSQSLASRPARRGELKKKLTLKRSGDQLFLETGAAMPAPHHYWIQLQLIGEPQPRSPGSPFFPKLKKEAFPIVEFKLEG